MIVIGCHVSSANKFETDGTLSEILSNGSLRLKAIVRSGECDTEIIDKVGRSALGTLWNPTTDIIFINVGVHDLVCNISSATSVLPGVSFLALSINPMIY